MIQGVYHQPYGYDNLYSHEDTERNPRDPSAGSMVKINASTWPVEDSQSLWIVWTKNSVAQPDIGAQWQTDKDDTSYWQASFGPFARGDDISYTVHANENQANEVVCGPFRFTVTGRSHVTRVTDHQDHQTSVDVMLAASDPGFSPVVRLAFTTPDALRVQFAPTGRGLTAAGSNAYTVTDQADRLTLTTSALEVVIEKQPYRLKIHRPGSTAPIVQESDPQQRANLSWEASGSDGIATIQERFQSSATDSVYGFGERYDRLNQQGDKVRTFIYNEYGDQAATERSYLAIPFFLSSAGYGMYVASSAYSEYGVGTDQTDLISIALNVQGAAAPLLDYYLFTGSPKRVLDRYTEISGRPQLPPKWCFGLWLSANEWNSQAMVKQELDAAAQNAIPATVLVLEQWADEATFYVWHGAEYSPKPGSDALKYADFSFPADGSWPDPKGMVADAHQRGVRVLLWQIPAFKEIFAPVNPHYPSTAPQQLLNDKAYAVQQGYVVGDGTGNPARLPVRSWFGNSMIPDFTNVDAVNWWMSKRSYLVDEVGIDGFKCDGGEAVFSRNNVFHDGRPGSVMHNAYPGTYIGAYNNFVRSKLGNAGAVFSRAGSAGAQSLSIYWAGDQLSSFDALLAAIRAGLNAGASGVPFWSWDLAGFAGPFPSAELYLRSAAMATFCPVMQLHAQWSAPSTSATRTPWHVQEVTGDPRVIPIFRKFADLRMNLLPYIYSEAKHAELHGAPIMRAMAIDYPDDPYAVALDQQYLFGGQMVVAPVTVEGASSTEIYIPRGEWWDFWNSCQFTGPRSKVYGVPMDALPVYARPGAIIPLNLNDEFVLGGAVGNSVDGYRNLTFRIYPSGHSSYDFFDDAKNVIATLQVNGAWASRQVSVLVPGLSSPPCLQVVAGTPQIITVDGVLLPGFASLGDVLSAQQGWYWDPQLQASLVKLVQSDQARVVVLNGLDKAAYPAEFADSAGTSTNTNHAGFSGLGFVDGFETVGDLVTFAVNADEAGRHLLRFRYANALGADASRNVRVDGALLGTLPLPALPDWDTWGYGEMSADLTVGPHQIQLAFESGNAGPINLDGLSLVRSIATNVSVLTQHNDMNRTGANLGETILTSSNVTPEHFGKLFSLPVKGQVFAQPLYVSGLEIAGKGVHNVLYIATMNNWVYAYDADDVLQANTPLWKRHLGPSIALPDPGIGPTFIDANKHDTGRPTKPDGSLVYLDILTEVGILSTPVISRENHALYVVSATKDPAVQGAAAYAHFLHALDLGTGAEKFGGPMRIVASSKGAGYVGENGEADNVSNGRVRFVSHRQLQRPGLLLTGGAIHVAFASYGDRDCYHGWIIAYDARTLRQTAVFNATPTNLSSDADHTGRGGIWQAGAGLAADPHALYFSTGNGGYADATDFGDCFVKLRLDNLKALDWFSPFNQEALASNDIDLGSSGILLVPDTDLLMGGGKESKFFLMKRNQMGHFDASAGNSQILQNFYVHAPDNPDDPIRSARKYDGSGHHIHGAPAYWQGPHGRWIYVWAEVDVVKAYELPPSERFETTPLKLKGIPNATLGIPASSGAVNGLGDIPGIPPGMPGGMISISANASAPGSGILWATHPLANANKAVVPGVLRAFDASDLGKELWNSRLNVPRDDVGSYAKFCAPTIANGRVYVATFSGAVDVYGLL